MIDTEKELYKLSYFLVYEFWHEKSEDILTQANSIKTKNELPLQTVLTQVEEVIKTAHLPYGKSRKGLKTFEFSVRLRDYQEFSSPLLTVCVSNKKFSIMVFPGAFSYVDIDYKEFDKALFVIESILHTESSILDENILCLRDKFYINSKNIQIARTGVSTACAAVLPNAKYSLKQSALMTEIRFTSEGRYEVEVVCHKEFLEEPAVFMDRLKLLKPRIDCKEGCKI